MFYEVAVNPFAKVSFGARIPDGKAATSVGTRVQQRKSVKQGTGDNMTVFLYPGINCCAGVVGCEGSPVFLSNATHTGLTGTTTYTQSEATFINKWRTVSCGMNISLINNSDGDEGWFEAIRLSPNSTAKPGLGADGGVSFAKFDPAATAVYPGCKLDSTNLVHQPSYVSGKLRDIHKYLFALNPHAGDHDFNNMVQTGGETSDLYDKSHDCIMVRIFGTPSQTTVLVHTAHNEELFYDEECPMSRFHGPTRTYQSAVEKANRACQSRVGAGILVTGNATTPIQRMGATAPRMRLIRRPMRRVMRRTYYPKTRVIRRRTPMKRLAKRPVRTYKKRVLKKSGYGLRLGM